MIAPAAPPAEAIAGMEPATALMLKTFAPYGVVGVVAILAIAALWRIALRLEAAWSKIEKLQEAHKDELTGEIEKRIESNKEIGRVADAVGVALSGMKVATEHRTEMTERIAESQTAMSAAIGRFSDNLQSLNVQNQQQSRDLDKLIERSETCGDSIRDSVRKIDDATRALNDTLARRMPGPGPHR
jgi:methyl-accepting chemotaxis protein